MEECMMESCPFCETDAGRAPVDVLYDVLLTCILILPVYGVLLVVACVMHSQVLAAIVLALLVVTVLLAEAVTASVEDGQK
jgi:hypothetical protein